ncbi:nuclear GTPase SLIP-GC-like isoform X1 [Heptranchias perlo]|uniref:nuclear GTPase SLIP-GC-like isoform X1 n=1 Tax=Heptranchias perlo TaxID=212740 RepID=UPI0035595C15
MEPADSEGAPNTSFPYTSAASACRGESDNCGATSRSGTPKGTKRNLSAEFTGRKKRKEPAFSPDMPEEDYKLWQNLNEWEERTKKVVEEICENLENVNYVDSDEKELLDSLKRKTLKLKDKCLRENMYIGAFGQTGAGKSSLVNAVLHERGLLPTSSSGACTSAVVKVQSAGGRKFKAEIEFLTEEEWNEELKVLVKLCEKEENSDTDDDEDGDTKEFEMAEKKLKTVYGDCGLGKSHEELLKMKIYREIPKNNKKSLSEDTAQALTEKLEPYIRSKSSQSKNIFWPLVKSVTVYVPNSKILPEGVVLIDFPGSGDSNKARDQMWKEHLGNCKSVWIVSKISRAIDEKIADEIFGETIKAATNGGRCQDIAFICTQTDDLQPGEYIREHGITAEEMNKSIEDDSSYRNKQVKRYCVLHRNDKVKTAMIIQYENKWKRIRRKQSAELEFSKDDLYVFTVSSAQYWKSPSSDSETEIPRLRKHIINMYLKERKKVVTDYVSEVWGLLLLLTSLNNSLNKQNNILSTRFKTMSESFEEQLGSLTDHMERFARNLQDQLKRGVDKDEKKCLEVIKRHTERPGTNSYQGYHRTLKAICNYDGVYNSPTFGPIDVNRDLSQSLHSEIDPFFESTFQFNKATRSSMKGHLDVFKTSLNTVIDEAQPTKCMGDNAWVWQCRQKFMKTELNALLSDLERLIIKRKMDIYKAAALSVQCTMKPAYKEAAQKKGAKILTSIQNILKEHVEQQKAKIFKDAADSVLQEFSSMKVHLEDEMKINVKIFMKLGLSQWQGRDPLPDFKNEFKQVDQIWNEVKEISSKTN